MSSSKFWSGCSPDHIFLTVLAALALAWQVPAPAIAQSTCGAYAVAVSPQSPGQPLSDDVVRLVDVGGTVLEASFEQPRTATPTPKPGVALLRSLGGIYSLLNVASGAVIPLQIPADIQMQLEVGHPSIRNASLSNFMLLSRMPRQFWLVDLTSGDAVDLERLLPGGERIESASISPDGNHLVFSGSGAGYLIDLRAPADPISLDSLPVLPNPDFSADSTKVIYAVESPSGPAIVRSLDLTTDVRSDLAVAPEIQRFDANEGSPILLFDGDTLTALDATASVAKPLFTWTGPLDGVLSDTTGAHLLIGDRDGDLSRWTWVDMATGETRELTELQDMRPLPVRDAQDQLLFTPGPATEEGTPGAACRSLDLTTGTVATPLLQDSGEVWLATSAGDDAGRYFLVNAVSPGAGRMWLVDAKAGTSRQLGRSTGNLAASVSPDGCQFALDIFDTVGEGRTSSVTISSTADGSPIAQLPDSLLLGWADIGASS